MEIITLSRRQVDLASMRFRFLAPCQRLRAIVCVLSAYLRDNESLTCVCLRLREQCLRSEITSVARVAHVLLLRFVAGNHMDVNTLASKRSELIRKRRAGQLLSWKRSRDGYPTIIVHRLFATLNDLRLMR